MSRRQQWEVDGLFGRIAALAWPGDWRDATGPRNEFRTNARNKMARRYEGWKAMEIAEQQVIRMERKARNIVETCEALRRFKSTVAGLDSYGEPNGGEP